MGQCILAGHTTGDTGGLRIATGSYVGNEARSVTLTFPFTPKVLIVTNRNRAGYFAYPNSYNNYGGDGFIVLYGTTKYVIGQNETAGNEKRIAFTWNGESVSWSGENFTWVLNDTNNNYDWLIIG